MADLSKPILFCGTARPDDAKRFYAETLGLALLEDTPFALVFQCGELVLRVQKAQAPFTPLPFTQLGWEVQDIAASAARLAERGVEFVRYPGMDQDELGIWSVPGAKVCWFRDPDGNTLSLTQHG